MIQERIGYFPPSLGVRLRTSGITKAVRSFSLGVVSLICSIALLAAFWALVSALSKNGLPGPLATAHVFWELVREPFYNNGPNDKGIGLQLILSLQRVFTGFALGSLVAIPLGVLLGSSPMARRILDPIVQIMRPVSPLAWFPIGLAVFKAAGSATIFMIFITSLWPTVINTAFGVASIPETCKNVAMVFRFSRWRYLTRVLLPYSLPHIFTGLRLSMGVAWLVIVAGEMLSGGTGIGFFVWDSWNALSLERVMSAVLIIGLVGLLLDRGFAYVAQRLSYEEAA
ncbi:MAG: nitrate ABC transporter, permease protein [Dehalococcoidia bacterium]|nr:nitrate ABC transporter, permease protein [Dehalococcoidia bacterium]